MEQRTEYRCIIGEGPVWNPADGKRYQANGFTAERNDDLYAACWRQGHIAVVDTACMEIKDHIAVPARIPASGCFAGKELEHLVVVRATFDTVLETDKNAGYAFICDAKTKGRKPDLFG